jgi:hypothetical protein
VNLIREHLCSESDSLHVVVSIEKSCTGQLWFMCPGRRRLCIVRILVMSRNLMMPCIRTKTAYDNVSSEYRHVSFISSKQWIPFIETCIVVSCFPDVCRDIKKKTHFLKFYIFGTVVILSWKLRTYIIKHEVFKIRRFWISDLGEIQWMVLVLLIKHRANLTFKHYLYWLALINVTSSKLADLLCRQAVTRKLKK